MADIRHILIIDDEKAVRGELVELLNFDESFAVHALQSFRPALELLSRQHIDLIILDIDLPGLDGRDACRNIRQRGFAMPIIMMTGSNSEADTISGLDAGANDYIAKPFKAGELLVRIRAQLRQYERGADITFAIGDYKFRPSVNALLTIEGQVIVHLTDRETALLNRLYQAGGDVVSRPALLRELWGVGPSIQTHTLETHIYRLRKKIEKITSNGNFIITESNGYKLRQ